MSSPYAYLCLECCLATLEDFVEEDLMGGLGDFFAAFEAAALDPFSCVFDFPLCDGFTGVMYVEVRLTLANCSPLRTRT